MVKVIAVVTQGISHCPEGATFIIYIFLNSLKVKLIIDNNYRVVWYSNNLYNVALYNIRQYFFTQKKFLIYESNQS